MKNIHDTLYTNRKLNKMVFACIVTLVLSTFVFPSCKKIHHEETVRVGLLHSLTGTMAISEIPLMEAEILAIEETNERGGVLGRKIEYIVEDGESSPQVFAAKMQKLLNEDKVATVFGCWTSASRIAVKPILEKQYGLLWYPLQYEGMEASPNIMYIGASPNQQIVPAVEYCLENIGKRLFFIGSDYIFPRTAKKIIDAQLVPYELETVGEVFVPMGHTDFAEIIDQIKKAKPDVVLNTLNGDSNLAFFHQLKEMGVTAEDIPVMSFSISEQEVTEIGPEVLAGHLTAWNYYQTIENNKNSEFVEGYKKMFGNDSVSGDPIASAHTAVHLWTQACEKAGSFDVEDVRIAAKGMSYDSPLGLVTIDGTNQHLYKPVRIGQIHDDGLIYEIWETPEPVKPDPYLSSYYWAWGLK
ncbi:MAG: urea ABC transporter substrate-binding protein [Treponema sp.]|nr:urea ABC transporter substrate-binding protein [Treponema sp.]MBR7079564.1 urea ABC transporter substrate-binding protein [Treponema sp.]